VEKLSDRDEGFVLENAPGFKNMVPLIEIIAEAKASGPKASRLKGNTISSLINWERNSKYFLKCRKNN